MQRHSPDSANSSSSTDVPQDEALCCNKQQSVQEPNASSEQQEWQTAEFLQGISFVGSTLAPFFLHDPLLESSAVLPLLKELKMLDVQELAEAWPFTDQEAVTPYVQLLVQGVHQCLNTSETDLSILANDYRRLFVGPAQKAAPYWGSVYTDKDGVTFGYSTMRLQDWLAQNSIALSFSSSDEPEDSLGALLALLAWCARENPALIPDLLRLHILPWSSHFLEIMENAAEHPFYKGLAGITRQSLEGAGKVLGLTVEIPRFYR